MDSGDHEKVRKRMKEIRKYKRKQWRERKKARVAEEKRQKANTANSKVEVKEACIQTTMDTEAGTSAVNIPKSSVNIRANEANTATSRGREMVNAALQRRGDESDRKRPALSKSKTKEEVPRKKTKVLSDIKLLDRRLIRRTVGVALGSGTYGTCYLAKYRGINVAVKEYNDRNGKKTLSNLIHSAENEARVIMSLGDHKGLPLLFGICRETLPVCLVLLFHGVKDATLTLFKAAEKDLLDAKAWYTVFLKIALALQHVHDKGFLHNDLKGNNVVLEEEEDIGNDTIVYNPVIIDFGCSVAIELAKPRPAQPNYLKEVNKRSHIAPEILDGTKKPTTSSDVYSFAHMYDFVRRKCKLSKPRQLRASLDKDSNARPCLKELIEYFTFC